MRKYFVDARGLAVPAICYDAKAGTEAVGVYLVFIDGGPAFVHVDKLTCELFSHGAQGSRRRLWMASWMTQEWSWSNELRNDLKVEI